MVYVTVEHAMEFGNTSPISQGNEAVMTPAETLARVAGMMGEERETRRAGRVADSVRAPKVAEVIAQQLRGRIVRGDIAPGEMLPSEKALMADFAVSRPTLREAFRILESEGLIQVLAGSRGGPQARLPDLSVAARQIGLYLQTQRTTLADVLEARAEFEPICARLLAQRCTAEGLAALQSCVDAQRAMLDRDIESEAQFAEWVMLTAEFHDLIALHCGNRTLAAQAMALRDVLAFHRRVGLERRRTHGGEPSTPSFVPPTVDDYETLLTLVRAHDAEGAEQHWHRHLSRAAELMFETRDRDEAICLFG
ncbi:FadR family transcriptional regulator [Nocardia nova]|uniref:FadR family transcriptional regulator n=2 Tax=Nocardia nova TaxID=37330 RepID=A0A2S6AMW9_9NOCA|nr:FadR family transcriptional regulator [Nocardia nova]